MSAAVIMAGYDSTLLTSFFALNSFNNKYQDQMDSNGNPTVSAPWKSGLTNAAQVGEILGLSATGLVLDRFGYKRAIAVALVFLVGIIFITFFATNLGMLLAGEILCGLPWGVFQTVTTAYASDVAPVALRGYLTVYVNTCWSIGQLIENGVMRAMVERQDEWAYRIPFGLQWIWPIPLLIGAWLMPESPWWLVRHGRHEEAYQSLQRLTSHDNLAFDARKTIAMMEHTSKSIIRQLLMISCSCVHPAQLEMDNGQESSYLDPFKGTNRRRTEIACIVWVAQAFCGANLMGYSTTFYERAGLPSGSAFSMSMGVYAIGLCSGFAGWFFMFHAGRRALYVAGQSIMLGLLLIIGLLGVGGRASRYEWATGSLIIVFALVYDSTVGPVCYSLVSEIPSTRLKAKTIVIARICTNMGSIVVNVLTNYQLTTTAWDWGPFTAFFWAGTNFICLIWMIFRLPEPKGRTYGELDILFENKINAWNFKRTKVDVFRGSTVAVFEENPASELQSVPSNDRKTVTSGEKDIFFRNVDFSQRTMSSD